MEKPEDRIKEWQDKAAEVLLIRTDKRADEEDYYVAGCEHVWNTHVVPLQEKAKYWELQYAELGKTAADHLEYANKKRLQNEQLESENKVLQWKLKEMSKRLSNWIVKLESENKSLREDIERLKAHRLTEFTDEELKNLFAGYDHFFYTPNNLLNDKGVEIKQSVRNKIEHIRKNVLFP